MPTISLEEIQIQDADVDPEKLITFEQGKLDDDNKPSSVAESKSTMILRPSFEKVADTSFGGSGALSELRIVRKFEIFENSVVDVCAVMTKQPGVPRTTKLPVAAKEAPTLNEKKDGMMVATEVTFCTAAEQTNGALEIRTAVSIDG